MTFIKRQYKIKQKIEESKKMEEQKKIKKNHWTQTNVDNATKKITHDIYGKTRQAPIHLKLDDFSVFINDKITRRGIAKGMVSIQEDLNNNILEVEKKTMEAYISNSKTKQCEHLLQAKYIMKVKIWTDIRFLMVNKAITPGEITELIRRQLEIDKDMDKWLAAVQKAISAEG